MNDIEYIQQNYIEQDELCERTHISVQELYDLINKQLLPAASYTIKSSHKISSPLGDQVVVTKIKKYFHRSAIELIKQNRSMENPGDFKKSIKNEFIQALENNKDKRYAYGNLSNEEGRLNPDQVNDAFEQEWQAYCEGIYGICTLHATGEEIVKKEIAVKKLIEFNEVHRGHALNDQDREKLKQLNLEYNAVSNLFAPYQREMSSRGKYLDKILALNALDEYVKRYDG